MIEARPRVDRAMVVRAAVSRQFIMASQMSNFKAFFRLFEVRLFSFSSFFDH